MYIYMYIAHITPYSLRPVYSKSVYFLVGKADKKFGDD